MDKKIEDKSNGTQETCLELCKIGGHDLSAYKPVFTSDSKYLLISSGNQLRRYVVFSGAFFTSHYFGHQNDIISVQINPQNSDEVIITSNDGLIIVWNLNENRKVNELNLILNKNYETVIWSQLVSNVFYFLIVNKKSVEPKCQLFYCPKNLVQQKYCINNTDFVNQTTNSVAFGPTTDPRFCATIYGNCLNIYEIPVNKSSQKRRHLIQEDKQFTCVVCHPNDDIIASGDSLGRIILWHNFMDSNFPSRSIMHWHNLPVNDLCFSPEGTYLYSVGAEMTLVRWNITGSHCGHNNFMPRLGMPIKFVTIDSKHHLIATSHDDNCIQILGPQMNGIQTTIEGLSLGIGKDCELSTGLLWNNKLNAIALNGRTGHLQFYSPSNQKQLFQLDIVNMNLISSTKEQIVFPTQVTKAAISDDGNWLSTIELRDDYETLPEIRLKFWLLNQSHKNYFLNTTIHLPHKSDVNYVQFSPKSNSMISTSNDKEFKIWNLNQDEDKKWWICSKVANFNNISIPTIANWSSDSSLLAIAFDNFITLWDVSNESNLKFMTKISVQDSTKSKLIFVGFGNENKSHYLIEGRHFIIRIWNLLDFSLLWTYQTSEPILCIAFNRWENVLALCLNTTIEFLKLDSNTPQLSVDIRVKNKKIISAIFTNENLGNSTDSKSRSVLFNSKFYCINDKQELFVLGENEHQFLKTEIMHWNTTENLSPIALMLINKKERKQYLDSQDFEGFLQPDIDTNKLVEEIFFNVPSHVLPPMHILCKTFLSSLLKCHEKDNTKDTKEEKTNSNKTQYNSKPLLTISCDTQSDAVSCSTNLDLNDREKDLKHVLTEENILNEKVDYIIEEDYSWLKLLQK